MVSGASKGAGAARRAKRAQRRLEQRSQRQASQAAKRARRAEQRAQKRRARAAARAARPRTLKEGFLVQREKVWARKRAHAERYGNPHQSFHRSYREDYYRPLDVPGLGAHALNSWRMITAHWRTFLCLLIFAVVVSITMVGLMSEETYVAFQDAIAESEEAIAGDSGIDLGNFARSAILLLSTISTGGLSVSSEISTLFAGLMFLLIWLSTVFLVRHYLVGQHPKLRDALYQSGAPIISTLAVLLLVILQLVPVFVTIVVYAAAINSGFVDTPFYALLTFLFALAMVSLSAYLVPSTLIALAAVTAPGLYPMAAVQAASVLMQGRRMRLVLRVLYLLLVLLLVWGVIMIPLIMLDLWAKATWAWLEGWPVIPLALLIMTCATFIYVSVYIYLFYREVLASDQRLEAHRAKSTATRLRREARADDVEIIQTVAESQEGKTLRRSPRKKHGTRASVAAIEKEIQDDQ